MKIKILFIFIINCILVQAQVRSIKVDDFTPKNRLSLSHIFNKTNFIPLETTDDCLFGGKYDVKIIGDYIAIITTTDNCFLFNKKDGKYIRTIGHKSNDPTGYQNTVDYFFDPHDSTFYFTGWNNDLVKYSINGKYLDKVKVPLMSSSINTPSVTSSFGVLDKNSFCTFFTNVNGKENKRIMIFSKEGEITKLYENKNIIEGGTFRLLYPDGFFYNYNNKLFFKEHYIDTVYSVSTEQLKPEYILDFGKYNRKYSDRYKPGPDPLSTGKLMESSKHILFEYYVEHPCIGIYDKSKEQLSSYRFDEVFINDLNTSIPIKFHSINSESIIIGSIEAPHIYLKLEQKNNNIIRSSKLKNVQPEDNPIIVFIE